MAGKRQTRQAKVAASSSDSQSASQDQDNTRISELMKRRGDRVKEKRQARQHEIETAHDARTESLHADIEQCAEEHDAEVRAIRKSSTQQLITAIQKKHQIQARIDRCNAELEQELLTVVEQLHLALNGRVKVLNEAVVRKDETEEV